MLANRLRLCGWVDSYRDHHGVMFVDLRDRYGKTQVAFRVDLAADIQTEARSPAERRRDLRHR